MSVTSLAALLLRASVEGALFALLVGAIARLAGGRMPAAARCALWWFASLRLLLGLVGLPGLPVSLPALTAPPLVARAGIQAAKLAAPISAAFGRSTTPRASLTTSRSLVAGSAAPAAPNVTVGGATPWRTGLDPMRPAVYGLLAIWIAGVLAALLVHVRDARRLVRIWRDATPIRSAEVHDWLAEWIGGGRAHRVELRASAAVGAPLILGGGVPRIIVPSACLDDDAARLRMALAHEASHVRRGDLGWGLVPALAQCVFWFHPFAHWCVNEYAQTREEACDAEALRLSAAAPHHYGELLVDFGVDASRPLHAAASCGSTHVHQLTRRLHMLALVSRSSRAQRTLAVATTFVIGVLSVVPVRFVAASAVDDRDPRQTASAVDDRHDRATSAARTALRRARSTSTPTTTSSSTRSTSHGVGFAYSTSDDDDAFSYGYTHGDRQTMSGTWDSDDQRWFERLRERAHGDYGWFRFDGKTYLVQATEDIDRIKEILRPETELGEQQGKLGEQQGKLGDQQGRLGDQQGALGEQEGELSRRLEHIESRLEEMRGGDGRSDLERQRDDIQSRMEELSTRLSELGDEQSKLGAQQSALGEKQSELGRRQEALSRQLRAKMREFGAQAIRDGRAVLVDD